MMDGLSDHALLRYSRHILLPQVGIEGQEKLLEARVLVVGLGGLGSSSAMYLAASGVGHMLIADYDHVDLSNLQRQPIHNTKSIDMRKTESAQKTLYQLNPDIKITPIDQKMNLDILQRQVADVDVVVDATDNFEVRYAINEACWHAQTPLVHGAAIRMEGQLSVFDARDTESPCYQCLYTEGTYVDESCVSNGILSPVVGVIGSMQAIEALKILLNLKDTLVGRLLLFDAQTMNWRELRVRRNAKCKVCGNNG